MKSRAQARAAVAHSGLMSADAQQPLRRDTALPRKWSAGLGHLVKRDYDILLPRGRGSQTGCGETRVRHGATTALTGGRRPQRRRIRRLMTEA